MSLGECPEHGKYLIRVKLRLTEEEVWSANRILYTADEGMEAYYKAKSKQTRRRSRNRRKKRSANSAGKEES